MTELALLGEHLSNLARSGDIGPGWQVCLVGPSGLVETSCGGLDGVGAPVQDDSLVAMYCGAKSILATACIALAEAGELSLSDEVRWLLPPDTYHPSLAAVTIEDILRHRSGIHVPGYLQATVLSPRERLEMALTSKKEDLAEGCSRYTEAAAWLVLGECARRVAGEANLAMVAQQLVLKPLGIEHHFDLENLEPDRRRVSVSIRTDARRPLLLELGESLCFRDNPGYGGFASMEGIARLLHGLITAGYEDRGPAPWSPSTVGTFLAHPTSGFDNTFGRTTAFVCGFMGSMEAEGYGVGGRGNFGQAGLSGMTTVVAAPSSGRVLAVHHNGLLHSNDAYVRTRPLIWEVASASLTASQIN